MTREPKGNSTTTFTNPAPSTQASGEAALGTAKVAKSGRTAPTMKGSGKTAGRMVRASLCTLMVTSTRDNGLMIRPTEWAYMCT
jgi:hypothetical protein